MEKRLLTLAEDQEGSGLFRFVSDDAEALMGLLTDIHAGLKSIGLSNPGTPWDSPHRAIVGFMNRLAAAARSPLENVSPEAAWVINKSAEHQQHVIGICRALAVDGPDRWDGGVAVPLPSGYLNRTLFGGWNLRRRQSRLDVLATLVREQIGHMWDLLLVEMPRDRLAWAKRMDWPQIDGIEYWLPDAEDKEIELVIRRVQPAEGEKTLAGFSAYATSEMDLEAGQAFMFRILLDAAEFWDRDFAAVFSANIRVRAGATVCDVQMGVADPSAGSFEKPAIPSDHTPAHIAIAWRYREVPHRPYLTFRVVLRERSPSMELEVSRVFAGQHYDPYRLNPAFRGAARPKRDDNTDRVLGGFERAVRSVGQPDAFIGSQAFIRPVLVLREGEVRFPMLLGTSNALDWYGLQPAHGIDFHREWGVIREDDIALDCGANAGQMAAYFAHVAGPGGRVIAFDPFLQNCLQVKAQAELNAPGRLITVQKGLGSRRKNFKVSNVVQMTSAAIPVLDDTVTIEIVPLDDYIGENPTMVKLDIEGAEVDALRGAAKLMRQCRPRLFIEVHTPFLGQFGHTLTDFFDAIPGDIYEIRFQVEGRDKDWRIYEPGMETGVTDPMLVYAVPKADAPH